MSIQTLWILLEISAAKYYHQTCNEAFENNLTFLRDEEVWRVEVEAFQEDYNPLALSTHEK